MLKSLLVPLDGSALAEEALTPACAIARATGATIDLVFAKPLPPYDGSLAPVWHDTADAPERDYLRRIAEETAHGASVSVSGAVVGGKPVSVIGRRAYELPADLIVMTSHGRTGVSRAWLGSVADGILRHTSVPVLLLRPRERRVPRRNASFLFERILVPLDGSDAAMAIVNPAIELAKCSSARLVLARVVKPVQLYVFDGGTAAYPTPIFDEDATKQAQDEARDWLTQTAQRLEKESSLRMDTVVVTDDRPAAAILAAAKTQRADLVAITSHGRGASRLVVGSVADKVLRGTRLPLLVARPLASGRGASRQSIDVNAVHDVPVGGGVAGSEGARNQ